MEAPSEKILCPICARENPLDADFCVDCGAPVSDTCNVDPYHHIFSLGLCYRKAASGKPKLIALIGMWAIFLPGILLYPLILIARTEPTPYFALGFLFQTFMWVVGILVLYKVTSNYLSKRPGVSTEAR